MIPIIIEVALSLIVIFFLFSTIVSFINEVIAILINRRGKTLFYSLKHLFSEDNKPGFLEKIYESTLINDFASKYGFFNFLNKGKPEFISSREFAEALIEQIDALEENVEDATSAENIQELKVKIDKIPNKLLKKKLNVLVKNLEEGKGKVVDFKLKVEEWFNDYMNAVSYVYKSQTKIIVFVISIIFCFFMNVDSLVLMEYFYENKDQREAMVSYAENVQQNPYIINDSIVGDERIQKIDSIQKNILADMNSFELPMGWKTNENSLSIFEVRLPNFKHTLRTEATSLGNPNPPNFLKKILGLFLTTIALTLGAPFWYELMTKLLSVRSKS